LSKGFSILIGVGQFYFDEIDLRRGMSAKNSDKRQANSQLGVLGIFQEVFGQCAPEAPSNDFFAD